MCFVRRVEVFIVSWFMLVQSKATAYKPCRWKYILFRCGYHSVCLIATTLAREAKQRLSSSNYYAFPRWWLRVCGNVVQKVRGLRTYNAAPPNAVLLVM
jgi:hypothetical protein